MNPDSLPAQLWSFSITANGVTFTGQTYAGSDAAAVQRMKQEQSDHMYGPGVVRIGPATRA